MLGGAGLIYLFISLAPFQPAVESAQLPSESLARTATEVVPPFDRAGDSHSVPLPNGTSPPNDPDWPRQPDWLEPQVACAQLGDCIVSGEGRFAVKIGEPFEVPQDWQIAILNSNRDRKLIALEEPDETFVRTRLGYVEAQMFIELTSFKYSGELRYINDTGATGVFVPRLASDDDFSVPGYDALIVSLAGGDLRPRMKVAWQKLLAEDRERLRLLDMAIERGGNSVDVWLVQGFASVQPAAARAISSAWQRQIAEREERGEPSSFALLSPTHTVASVPQ